MNRLDRWTEELTRGLAATFSRRSLLARLGQVLVGSLALASPAGGPDGPGAGRP
jgi:hypothetical protein